MLATAAFAVIAAIPHRGQIAGFIFVGPFAYLAFRQWLFGVRVRDEGIIIGGLLWSRRVSWTEIDHFACESAGPYPFVGRLIPRGGKRPIILVGIDAGRRPTARSRADAQAKVDLLNAELARRRSRGDAQ